MNKTRTKAPHEYIHTNWPARTVDFHSPHAPAYPPSPVVFVGLAAIARAVGAGQLTVRKWIQEENFPARRCTDGIYRADPDAIRRWFTDIREGTEQAQG